MSLDIGDYTLPKGPIVTIWVQSAYRSTEFDMYWVEFPTLPTAMTVLNYLLFQRGVSMRYPIDWRWRVEFCRGGPNGPLFVGQTNLDVELPSEHWHMVLYQPPSW